MPKTRKSKAIKPEDFRQIAQQKIVEYIRLLKKSPMVDQEIRTMLVLFGQDVLFAACTGASVSAAQSILQVVTDGILGALHQGVKPADFEKTTQEE